MNESNDIVVWSGGMDSTLVLDKLCSSGKSIWAFSVVWDLLDELKTEQEKKARKNYLEYAKGKGYNISYYEINITANMGAEHLGLPQLLGWCSFLIPYLPKESNLYFGYHDGDEFWEFALATRYFMDWATYIGERKVKLEYPLKNMRKYQILEEFRKRGIPFDCGWTCETPVLRRKKIFKCGKCGPCIALKLAECEAKLRNREKTG
jgi:7-cyano-7-deazaguanine synthase in queuosine biosynthesis